MAKIGNEAKLILKLVDERMTKLRDSRIQTPDDNWRKGYHRAYDDYKMTVGGVISELENTSKTPFDRR